MSILTNPDLLQKLEQDIANGLEMSWLISHFAYSTGVLLDETPVINFCNYRYKILETFAMTYRHEKAVLNVEIAPPDTLLILGTFAEYKLMNRLIPLNNAISRGTHSWPKLLAMAQNNVVLLVNCAYVVMHLFSADLVPLSDNEIVYCYILAAAVVQSIHKDARSMLVKEIQKKGLKRTQHSISDRAEKSSTFGSNRRLLPKDESGISESVYAEWYANILNSLPPIDPAHKIQPTPIDTFIAAAQRLSIRKACLRQLAENDKDLPQVGRLLHLGRTENAEPKTLVQYLGEEVVALPANDLGNQRYRNADSKSVYGKGSRIW